MANSGGDKFKGNAGRTPRFAGDAENFEKEHMGKQPGKRPHEESPSTSDGPLDPKKPRTTKKGDHSAVSQGTVQERSPDRSHGNSSITGNFSDISPPSVKSVIKTNSVTHSPGESSRGAILQDNLGVSGKYLGHPNVDQARNLMKNALRSVLEEAMRDVNLCSFSASDGHETATLINLCKLFDSKLEETGTTAFQAALQLEEGEKIRNEGKSKLKRALQEVLGKSSRL